MKNLYNTIVTHRIVARHYVVTELDLICVDENVPVRHQLTFHMNQPRDFFVLIIPLIATSLGGFEMALGGSVSKVLQPVAHRLGRNTENVRQLRHSTP